MLHATSLARRLGLLLELKQIYEVNVGAHDAALMRS